MGIIVLMKMVLLHHEAGAGTSYGGLQMQTYDVINKNLLHGLSML